MFKKSILTKLDCSYILALLIACKKYKLTAFYKNKISDLIIRLKNKANYLDKFDLAFINSLVKIHEKTIITAKNKIKKNEQKIVQNKQKVQDLKMSVEYLFKYNRFFNYAILVIVLLSINSSKVI